MEMMKAVPVFMVAMIGITTFAVDAVLTGQKTIKNHKNRGAAARVFQQKAADIEAGTFKAEGQIFYMPVGVHGHTVAGLLSGLKASPDQNAKLWNELFRTGR